MQLEPSIVLSTGQLSLSESVREAALAQIFPRTLACLRLAEEERALAQFAQLQRRGTGVGVNAFAAFLAGRKWPAHFGYLPDLAQLEWLAAQAARLPELATREGFDRVVSATEPEWFGARFRFHPSVKLLDSDWPLPEIFLGLAEPRLRRPGCYLMHRQGGESTVREVDANEAALIRALELGVPLGVVLDRPGGPEFDAFLFHDWIQSGLLREIVWSSSAPN